MRYIDANKLQEVFKELHGGKRSLLIDTEPTADVRENVHGEWIDCTEDGYVECPFCHSATNCDGNKEELHFCFSCGAEMRGE